MLMPKEEREQRGCNGQGSCNAHPTNTELPLEFSDGLRFQGSKLQKRVSINMTSQWEHNQLPRERGNVLVKFVGHWI